MRVLFKKLFQPRRDKMIADRLVAAGELVPTQEVFMEDGARTERFTKQPASPDLAGLDLQRVSIEHEVINGLNWREGKLTNAKLRDVTLQGVSLQDADLQGAVFEHVHFLDCNLDGANANNSIWLGCNFRKTNAKRAQFGSSKFLNTRWGEDCVFSGAIFDCSEFDGCAADRINLTGARLCLTNWKGSKLSFCQAQDSSWISAKMLNSRVEHCHYDGSNMEGLEFLADKAEGVRLGGYFRRVNLVRAKLHHLAGVFSLRGSDLTDAELKGLLKGVTFDEASLIRTCLRDAIINEATFGYSKLIGTKMPIESARQALRLFGAEVQDLEGADTAALKALTYNSD